MNNHMQTTVQQVFSERINLQLSIFINKIFITVFL